MFKNDLLSSVYRSPPDDPPGNPPPGNPPPGNPPPAAIAFDKMPEVIRTKLTGRGITPDQAGFEKLATSFDAADRYLGGDRTLIPVPPADKATPEDWGKVYSALGRPEKPDNYNFNLPAGTTMDPTFKTFAQQMLFDMGVPAGRAQATIDAYMKYGNDQAVAQAKAADLQLETYKTSRGAAYDQELARGKEVAKSLGLDQAALNKIESALAEPGKPGAAAIVELFAKLGSKLAEGGFKTTGGGGSGTDPSQMSYEQANTAITTKQADVDFMKKYNGANEPGHLEAVKELEALFARRASMKKAA